MRLRRPPAVALILAAAFGSTPAAAGTPTWRGQVLDPEVSKVCYAVVSTDVDGDGKPDVVAVANDAVVWYQNPTWQKRDIIRNATEPDNVCLQPHDVDGDGRVDFALGSAWRPTDTRAGGNLAILTRTGAPEGTWRVVPIASEPTLHRVRWGHVLDSPRPQLVVAPLQGRDTRGPDWGQGRGSRIMVLKAPDRPFDETWPSEMITDRLHAVHNIEVLPPIPSHVQGDGPGPGPIPVQDVLAASWEGVFRLRSGPNGSWSSHFVGAGDQFSRPNRGTSEVRLGRLRDDSPFLAAIEPWHGSKFVVYRRGIPADGRSPSMTRQVVDESLAWGHAVACANLDGDGDDEVVVGQRDPNPRLDPATRGPGVLIYDPKPGPPSAPLAFDRTWVDMGGVSVEDLIVADLNGDRRPDIVAGGRATHNVKVYWNEPPAAP